MKILSVLLEITPDLATRAIETPLSSLIRTMWCLRDLTPSSWCKMDAHSTNFESISTWEDLTTRFLAQFFPLGRTAKLRNDILMFQQHQGESLFEACHFKDLLQKVTHHGLVSSFMASQDTILSKFEADFKQQGQMTNKINTVFKAINDRMTGALPGEMPKKIKDPRLFTLPSRLADGTKSYPVGIVKNVKVHIGRLKLLEDLYVIDMEKDPTTPSLLGRGFLATASAVIDCRKAKVAVGERVTRLIFGVKEINIGARTPYYAKKDFTDYHLPDE
ncbi:MAK10-like protein [Tanacetum coccineum]